MIYEHTLQLATEVHLEKAFSRLMASVHVEDQVVETTRLRLRFTSPPGRAADLIERIYLEGGLRWCERQLRTA